MQSYYTSQAYDAPASYIWSILTDFASWPAWFPHLTQITLDGGAVPGQGAELLAVGDDPDEWTRWRIAEWHNPSLLVCEHVESTVPVSRGVDAAYLQFELFDEPDGCTLEVEIGAEGSGIVGDFFVGMTLGTGARRMLPELVDAFTAHVVRRAAQAQ